MSSRLGARTGARRSQPAVGLGGAGRLGAVAGVRLGDRTGQVVAHRPGAQVEGSGDVVGVRAARGQSAFASFTQGIDSGVPRLPAARHISVSQPRSIDIWRTLE